MPTVELVRVGAGRELTEHDHLLDARARPRTRCTGTNGSGETYGSGGA